MQNANECKSLFSSAILTLSDQPIHSLFSRDYRDANDDLRFQREWFRNLVEKNRREVAKAFFRLKQNRTR